MNKSAFSFLRTLTTWHCPYSPAARRCCRAAIDRYLPPAEPTAANVMQDVDSYSASSPNEPLVPPKETYSSGFATACPYWDRQTDRQTDGHRTVTQTPLCILCGRCQSNSRRKPNYSSRTSSCYTLGHHQLFGLCFLALNLCDHNTT